MAEFLIHRDPLQKTSSLVLRKEGATYGDEKPFNDPCRDCPVSMSRIARGCIPLGFNSHSQDVRATMPTSVEDQCAIIQDSNHNVSGGNDAYDSQMALYQNKKTFIETRDRVRRVMERLNPKPAEPSESPFKLSFSYRET